MTRYTNFNLILSIFIKFGPCNKIQFCFLYVHAKFQENRFSRTEENCYEPILTIHHEPTHRAKMIIRLNSVSANNYTRVHA